MNAGELLPPPMPAGWIKSRFREMVALRSSLTALAIGCAAVH
jgi:hypothetical protein